MLITEGRVREVLGGAPGLTDEDVAALADSANADPGEDASWLPYYKLALAVLVDAYAMMAIAYEESARAAADGTRPGDSRLRFADLLARRARAAAALHLRPCGIGPDRSPKTAAEVDARIAATWPPAVVSRLNLGRA